MPGTNYIIICKMINNDLNKYLLILQIIMMWTNSKKERKHFLIKFL